MRHLRLRTAAVLAAFALSATTCAAAGNDRVFPPEADDYISLTADIEDGEEIFLHEPVFYTRGGEQSEGLRVRVEVPRGEYLHYEWEFGDISVECRAVRMDGENLWGDRYDYYILTIAPDADASQTDQDFRINLSVQGLSAVLKGRTAPERQNPLLSGMEYEADLDGGLYELYGEIAEEEAVVQYPNGLSVAFLGDYGPAQADLGATVRTDANSRTVSWTFRDRPSFEDDITVRIEAPRDAEVYEVYGADRRKLDTKYRDGCLVFRAQGLTAYELVI